MKNPERTGDCAPSPNCCNGGPSDLYRREFLKSTLQSAAGAALAAGGARAAYAGPYFYVPDDADDYLRLIPADKKLNPRWLASLTARGEPTIYRGDALDRIGMPVGGACAGQMYLSGDGRLWLWDIFNQYQNGILNKGSDGANYIKPLPPESPVVQGFSIRAFNDNLDQTRALDRKGFPDVTFQGSYPIGTVNYSDPAFPASIQLEAWSPFIPLDEENSGLPATVFDFTIKNESETPIRVQIGGYLENAIGLHTSQNHQIALRNRSVMGAVSRTTSNADSREQTKLYGRIVYDAIPARAKRAADARPPIVIEDFENDHYEKWIVEGDAFGSKPSTGNQGADQHISGFEGKGFVNSYQGSDAPQGKLVSPEFAVERDYINFLIGGGNHPNETCIKLMIRGIAVRTTTGRDSDAMEWASWNVGEFAGEFANIEIVDGHSGGWGHIDIDQIELSDVPRSSGSTLQFADEPDFGTFAFGPLPFVMDEGDLHIYPGVPADAPRGVFSSLKNAQFLGSIEVTGGGDRGFPLGRPVGAAVREFLLDPGASQKVTFVLAWHFPNLSLPGFPAPVGRRYSLKFKNADEVLSYIVDNYDSLSSATKLWVDTWYNSTLPYWLLDRSFANLSTLATSTAHWFRDGRFWAWEGVGCCHGTCTHVWHYAWGVGRIFPKFERLLRERVEFGDFFDEKTGIVSMRGEFDRGPAVDGQAGAILRLYRDHTMSADGAFLKKHWPRARAAAEYLLNHDSDGDGILDGDQPNTLDAAWFGKIAWISGLYLSAIHAAELMASETAPEDAAFIERCRSALQRGRETIIKELFNGEFFIQLPDSKHLDAIGADAGCYIDQVLGDSWARQVGIGPILPIANVKSALASLWKYNFATDVGPFRKHFKEGRSYALAGDGGLVMCTWPKGGKREDWKKHWQYMYFNECMSGFEHQAAAHMVWEGMITEGLAVERAIHDRYSAHLRNPYNEVECSDHYARAMASYGVFLAACGFELHGPKQHIGFAPAFSADDFRCAFTAPEGWGSFSQKRSKNIQSHTIEAQFGIVKIQSVSLRIPADAKVTKCSVGFRDGAGITSDFTIKSGAVLITVSDAIALQAKQALEIELQLS
ncbi:MAG: hypothetical protein HY286_10350 [Planctomycetes bacterium]|nr:hypothetical protein [Planctomycetota bacterium]